MSAKLPHSIWFTVGLTILLCASCAVRTTPPATETEVVEETTQSMIVQGETLAKAAEAVRAVGATVTSELGIIRSVVAQLTPTQQAALKANPAITRIWADGEARVSSAGA